MLQCEKLLKLTNSYSELGGPLDQLNAIQERKIRSNKTKTMGTLVRTLTESYMGSPTVGKEKSQTLIAQLGQNHAPIPSHNGFVYTKPSF